MKQWIAGFMIVLLIVCSIGCAASNDPIIDTGELPGATPNEQPTEERPPVETPLPEPEESIVTVDSAGREVSLPQPLTHIYPANQEAQSVLFSLAPEKMAGWYRMPVGDAASYIDAAALALPSLSGNDAEPNWAAMKAAGAQAVLLMGSALSVEELDSMQEKAGMPVLFIDSGLDTLPDAYRALGGLLGVEELAEEFVEYIAPAIEGLNAYASGIDEKARKRVYIAGGTDGLTPQDSEILPLAGSLNVVPGGQLGQALAQSAFEKLQIDTLLAEDITMYDKLCKNSAWNKLELVEMGMFYPAPDALFSWLKDSTTAGRLLGAKWLGNLLYPDVFAYDMVEETKLHYDLFWHCQLTDAQAEALLANSTLRPRG